MTDDDKEQYLCLPSDWNWDRTRCEYLQQTSVSVYTDLIWQIWSIKGEDVSPEDIKMFWNL